MTRKQFYKAVDIARKYGEFKFNNGARLCCHFEHDWSVKAKDGNTIDVATDPMKLVYIFC